MKTRFIVGVAAVAAMWLIALLIFHEAARTPEDDARMRVIDSTRAANAGRLGAIRDHVDRLKTRHIVLSWADGASIIVEPRFFKMDFASKSAVCTEIAEARTAFGLSPDFILRESMNNRRIGEFLSGTLNIEQSP